MGAARDIKLTNLPLRGISINSDAGGVTSIDVEASDSGIMFINKEASTCTYTLPVVAEGAGKWFWFYSAVTATLAITSPTAIVMGFDSATRTTITSNGTIGDCCMVIGDGTNYYAFVIYATWV